ncbi:MAG TPA: hypothetical protein VLT32_16685 [Candidatus Sulfomarinibacteraceae bacterium]|nr:hypothetical protein [Candidatus Sulfomarinibacteraceae bacterium]
MSGFKVFVLVLVALFMGVIVGYVLGPKPPPKMVHVYHAEALPSSAASAYCTVAPDTITIPKGSLAELEIANLSGEKVNVAFSSDIAVTTGNVIQQGLDPGDSWKVELKTSESGRFGYQVMGMGNPTCFTVLPNPRIVIP